MLVGRGAVGATLLTLLAPLLASGATHGSFRRRAEVHDHRELIQARQYSPHREQHDGGRPTRRGELWARQAGPSATPCPAGTTATSGGCVPDQTVLFASSYDSNSLDGWSETGSSGSGIAHVSGAHSGSSVYRIQGGRTTLTRTVSVIPGSTYVVRYSLFVSLGSVTGSTAPASFRLVITEVTSATRKRAAGDVLVDTGDTAPGSEAPDHFISYANTQVTFGTGTATSITFQITASTQGVMYLDDLDAQFLHTGDCAPSCGSITTRSSTGICEPGYTLVAGTCIVPVATCPDPNASVPAGGTACACNTGYVASASSPGTCEPATTPADCPSLKRAAGPTPATCGDCLDPNAQGASSSAVCSTCKPGYAVDSAGACQSCATLGQAVNAAGGCSPIVPCTDPAAVRDATTGQCTCPETTDASGACQTCVAAGLAVNPAGGCGACRDTNAVRLAGAACRCRTGYADSGSGVCGPCSTLKRSDGADGTCGGCLDPGAALASDGTCACRADYTADGTGTCVACSALKRDSGTAAGQCGLCIDRNAQGPANGLCSTCSPGYATNSAGACVLCADLGLSTTADGLCNTPCLDSMKTFANGACTCSKENAELKDGACVCSAGYQQLATGTCVPCSSLGRDASTLPGTACGLCTQRTRTVGPDGSCACGDDSSDDDPAATGVCGSCTSLGRQTGTQGTCGSCRPDLVLNGAGTSCICRGELGAATFDPATGTCSCNPAFTKDGTGTCVRTCDDNAFVPNPATGACDVSCASLSRGNGDGRVCSTSCLLTGQTIATPSDPQSACSCPAPSYLVGNACLTCNTQHNRENGPSVGACGECAPGYAAVNPFPEAKCWPVVAQSGFESGSESPLYFRAGNFGGTLSQYSVVPGGTATSPLFALQIDAQSSQLHGSGVCYDVPIPITRNTDPMYGREYIYYMGVIRVKIPQIITTSAIYGYGVTFSYGGSSQNGQRTGISPDGQWAFYRYQVNNPSLALGSTPRTFRICMTGFAYTATGPPTYSSTYYPIEFDEVSYLRSHYPYWCGYDVPGTTDVGVNENAVDDTRGMYGCGQCSAAGRQPSTPAIEPFCGPCLDPSTTWFEPASKTCYACSAYGRELDTSASGYACSTTCTRSDFVVATSGYAAGYCACPDGSSDDYNSSTQTYSCRTCKSKGLESRADQQCGNCLPGLVYASNYQTCECPNPSTQTFDPNTGTCS